MFVGLYLKYRLFLSDVKEALIFSTDFFSKITQILYFMGIPPMGADLFHANGRTDMQTRRNE